MAHRLASSKRDTKNASAASCRHIMVLPWKRRSLLPTSWAISRTSHEKGSFRIRSSVLFWYRRISQRATVPGRYLLVFFSFPPLWNSFHGALPPTVGRSFLRGDSSPKTDGLASAAIWGQLSGWRRRRWPTHSLQPTCLLNPPLHLLQHLLHLPRGWGAFGRGGVVHRRGGLLFRCLLSTHPSSQPPPTPLISSLSGHTG